MQDDIALDRAYDIARAANQPCYVLYPDGYLIDQTGQFPDKWYGYGKEPTAHERKYQAAKRELDLAEKMLADAQRWIANANRILDELEADHE